MNAKRKSWVESRGPELGGGGAAPGRRLSPADLRSSSRAFTLIEITIVVAIIGMVLAAGIPSVYRSLRRDAFRQAIMDVMEACSNARARAILEGAPTELRFQYVDNAWTFGVGGAGGVKPAGGGGGTGDTEVFRPMSGAGLSGRISERILVEMLDVNFIEYKDFGEARVRFYPNGTSDEFSIVLHSDQNEWRKVTLEVVTGLADMEVIR